jgi:hypothetical protein
MDLQDLDAFYEKVKRERQEAGAELAASRTRVSALEAKVQRLDRLAADLKALAADADANPPSSKDSTTAATAPGTAGPDTVRQLLRHRRNHHRNDMILDVMSSGPRNWTVADVVHEMERRDWTKGLTNPIEAVRMALSRMVDKRLVVRIEPQTFVHVRRMGEPPSRWEQPDMEATAM